MKDIKLGLVWQDNQPVIKMRCPGCGCFAEIDGDQYYGRVSLDCPNCEYHETHDLRGIPIITPDPRAPR